jgi:hypothetical protein
MIWLKTIKAECGTIGWVFLKHKGCIINDDCLCGFIKRTTVYISIVSVYVDDINIIGKTW